MLRFPSYPHIITASNNSAHTTGMERSTSQTSAMQRFGYAQCVAVDSQEFGGGSDEAAGVQVIGERRRGFGAVLLVVGE